MCGRVVWLWDPQTGMLIRRFDDEALDDPDVRHVMERNRYNVPPASHLPVIAGRGDRDKVEIARWGFPIPERPNGVFNTRIEKAFTSPMWGGLIAQHHCVFPVKGFYEWKRQGKVKTPFFIARADGEVMLLGGLIGRRTWKGESLLCGSIVTCAPNEAMAEVHDRMPIVLTEDEAREWLHPDRAGVERVRELASPREGVALEVREVGARVNATVNDEPSLMEPVATKKWF